MMYFLTQMKGPLHCKPQAADSKSSPNENAQSESCDNTMEKWTQLFCNAVGQPPGLCPKQAQGAVSMRLRCSATT